MILVYRGTLSSCLKNTRQAEDELKHTNAKSMRSASHTHASLHHLVPNNCASWDIRSWSQDHAFGRTTGPRTGTTCASMATSGRGDIASYSFLIMCVVFLLRALD